MALFFGCLGKSGRVTDFARLNELLAESAWTDSSYSEVSYGQLSGIFLFDNNLPHDPEDFTYLDSEDEIMVLMTGSIYNIDELAKNLDFNNSSVKNPEIVLMLFKRYGIRFVDLLNGDFTIFLYDKKGQAYLFRDHLGIRPVSYLLDDDAFWFSSDSLALCKVFYGSDRISEEFLIQFLLPYDSRITNLLPSDKVKKLAPGHLVTAEGSIRRFWNPSDIRENKKLTFNIIIQDLKKLVSNSVLLRADSRFKASAHLSGGLDSGLTAVLAKQNYCDQKKFYGISWTPPGIGPDRLSYNENDLVENLCKSFGIDSLYSNIDNRDYIRFTANWRLLLQFFHEEKIRETLDSEEANLIFSGWGGDEFISYSDDGVDTDLLLKLKWIALIKKYKNRGWSAVIKRIMTRAVLPVIYPDYFIKKNHKNNFKKYLIGNKRIKLNNSLYSWKSRKDAHLKLLYYGHIAERTEDWCINGYRHGIEYRYPLLDKRIVEYMLQIPSDIFYDETRSRVIMREICKDILPEKIVEHKYKNDPVLTAHVKKCTREAANYYLSSLDQCMEIEELSFINFEALGSEVQKILNSQNSNENDDALFQLQRVIHLSGFIKYYHSKSEKHFTLKEEP